MKILILGGTQFVGRHIVEAALARGHEITIFNRGRSNPALFADCERLHGDRDSGLALLEGRRWDAVIDTSGYLPRIVRKSAQLLSGAVERYIFISTIMVYENFETPGSDEHAPLATIDEENVALDMETYGPLKVLCEAAVERALPERTLIIRPGIIIGPYDHTDRFPYWPRRMARGGQVLAPGNPDRQLQLIDVRDLAEWTVQMTEARATGIYNTTGPDYLLTMGDMLKECIRVAGSAAQLTWVSDQFLFENEIDPFMELPLWITDDIAGLFAINSNKAMAAGLKFRPLAETVKDVLEWERTRPADEPRPAGISPERETELLQIWQIRMSHHDIE